MASHIVSLIEMSKTLKDQRKFQEALDLYEDAIQFHPDNAFAYAEKGHLLYVLQRYSDALTAYTRAMELDSKYTGAFVDKETPLVAQGKACYEQGDYQQALAIFEQVIQFNPDNKDAQKARLKVLRKLEQIAEEKRIAEHKQKLLLSEDSWLCEEPFRYD